MAGARADVPVLMNEVRRLRGGCAEAHRQSRGTSSSKPGVTPRDVLALVEAILKEEDTHWKGGRRPARARSRVPR